MIERFEFLETRTLSIIINYETGDFKLGRRTYFEFEQKNSKKIGIWTNRIQAQNSNLNLQRIFAAPCQIYDHKKNT